MVVFGWIIMIVFALLGMTLIGFLVYEFGITHFRLIKIRVSTELEIMREDINAKKEIKRAKLAEKRENPDKPAKSKPEVVHTKHVDKHEDKPVEKEKEIEKPIPVVEEDIEIVIEQPKEEQE